MKLKVLNTLNIKFNWSFDDNQKSHCIYLTKGEVGINYEDPSLQTSRLTKAVLNNLVFMSLRGQITDCWCFTQLGVA